MGIMEIIKRAIGTDDKTICSTKMQDKTTTTPANMEPVLQEVETALPKNTLKASKTCTTNTAKKNKKRYSTRVYSEDDFEKELKAAINRVNYLRNFRAKKLGIKKNPVKKKAQNRTAAMLERDRDYHFYRFWLKEHKDILASKYINLKTGMIGSAKTFTTFHSRLWNVTQKFGSDDDKKFIKELSDKEVE